MLVASIFSFSHNVFYLSQTIFQLFTFFLSSANAVKLEKSKILSFGKELNCFFFFFWGGGGLGNGALNWIYMVNGIFFFSDIFSDCWIRIK